VDAYHFDDMLGTDRGIEREMPVAMKPADWHDRKEGICYVMPFDFQSKSGSAWKNPNGTFTLVVHSNCNYTFRLAEKEGLA